MVAFREDLQGLPLVPTFAKVLLGKTSGKQTDLPA